MCLIFSFFKYFSPTPDYYLTQGKQYDKILKTFFPNKTKIIGSLRYDLFKFKGGVYCRHAWKEVLYRLKKATTIKKGDDMPENINDYKTHKTHIKHIKHIYKTNKTHQTYKTQINILKTHITHKKTHKNRV